MLDGKGEICWTGMVFYAGREGSDMLDWKDLICWTVRVLYAGREGSDGK